MGGDVRALVYRGVDRLLAGYVVALFFSIVLAFVFFGEILWFVMVRVTDEVFIFRVMAISGAVLSLAFIPFSYVLLFGGFSDLASVDPGRYGIGRIAALINIAVQVFVSVSLIVIAIRSPHLDVLRNLDVVGGLVSFVMYVPIAIALYRLYQDYPSDFLKYGIFMIVVSNLLNVVPSQFAIVLDLMGLMGFLYIIKGLNEVKSMVMQY